MTHIIETTWLNFKQKPSKDSIFAEDAVVVYVPTGAGAKGSSEIRKMYLSVDHNQRVHIIKETIRKRTLSTDSIVEECEWNISFTSETCNWLLPKTDPSIYSEAVVTFPVVISASFKGDKISILRFYWDQATVLKQLKLISSREHSGWPVLGAEELQFLRDPTNFNPLTKNVEAAAAGGSSGSAKFKEATEAQPRAASGTHARVFAQEDDFGPKKPTKPSQSNHARLFGGGEEEAGARQTVSTTRSFKPERRNIFGGTGGDEEELLSATSSTSTQQSRTGNRIFGGDEEESPVTSVSTQRSRATNRIFGGEEEEAPKAAKPKAKSSIFDDGADEPFRPSSRVTHPGGGGGKSRVFSDDSDVEERRAFTYNPSKYTSQISMSNEEQSAASVPAPAPEPALETKESEEVEEPVRAPAGESQDDTQPDPRRSSRSIQPNKNVTQWALGGEADEADSHSSPKRSTRSMDPDKNTVQWELGGESEGAPKARTAFAINPNKHTSQWALDGNMGDGPTIPRSSTRVLQHPGGTSSIKFQ